MQMGKESDFLIRESSAWEEQELLLEQRDHGEADFNMSMLTYSFFYRFHLFPVDCPRNHGANSKRDVPALLLLQLPILEKTNMFFSYPRGKSILGNLSFQTYIPLSLLHFFLFLHIEGN